jgi:hypothetical protein
MAEAPPPKPQRSARFRYRLRRVFTRQSAANTLMLSFIIFTSIGAGLFLPPLGLVVAGVTCGVFGFLLGLE